MIYIETLNNLSENKEESLISEARLNDIYRNFE